MTNKELADLFIEEATHQKDLGKSLTNPSGGILRDHSNAIEAMARIAIADALTNLALRLKFP